MSSVDLAADVLLALGVAAEIACVLGVVSRASVYDRLHYAAAATTIGPGCIVLAIALRESIPRGGGFEVNSSGIETVVAGLALFLLNPVLTHATARAARLQERGTLEPRAEERGAP
jgi:monovalent cation/proton antiporter MnhG/PhaG subunit